MRHSELGPSKAHRYRLCAGSVNAERGLPDDSGIDAAQGQCFHEYADLCLTFGLDPHVFIGKPFQHDKFGVLFFDQEMADNMIYGLDIVRDLAAEPEALLFVETEVDLSRWLGEGEIGTSDCGVINVRGRKITIFDWKYGMIPVQPHWNDQAILYGLGFWDTIAEELFEGVDPADIEVEIIIEQPRAPGGGGVWHTTMDVLLKEGRKITIDAEATRDPDAERTPGPKQCQWCKAAKKGTCPEFIELQLATFSLGLEEVDDYAEFDVPPPMPKVLTPERRSYILKFAPVFSKWIENLHKEAYDDAVKGRPAPGLKLVPGRTPARKWKDEEKAKIVLEHRLGPEKAYSKKLLSPTQVEESMGKKAFKAAYAHHVKDEDAKPILVPTTDRRDAIPDVGSRFDAAMEDDLI